MTTQPVAYSGITELMPFSIREVAKNPEGTENSSASKMLLRHPGPTGLLLSFLGESRRPSFGDHGFNSLCNSSNLDGRPGVASQTDPALDLRYVVNRLLSPLGPEFSPVKWKQCYPMCPRAWHTAGTWHTRAWLHERLAVRHKETESGKGWWWSENN